MGGKLLWSGLTLIELATITHVIPDLAIVGVILMVLGCILSWLDR